MKRGTKVIRSGKVELFLVQSKRKYEWERWLFLVLKFTLGKSNLKLLYYIVMA